MKRTILSIALMALVACGTQVWLKSESPKAADAWGTVDTAPGPNSTLKVTITVEDLPPPDKVALQTQVYIVWIKPPASNRQKLGVLQFENTPDKKKTIGKLSADTPFHNFEVYVTPEPGEDQNEPTGDKVLRAIVDR